MSKRNIIKIDEEKCNGCGLCVPGCAEGALKIIDGKAKLVSEVYCDGLGACLGECPTGALTIEERESEAFDEKAMQANLAAEHNNVKPKPAGGCPSGGGCPGSAARDMTPPAPPTGGEDSASQLTTWPVQLTLVSPMAPYFENADLLLCADCVPFAYPDFHAKLLAGKKVVIACPKLDDTSSYAEKLTEIIKTNKVKSITVAHMEVPCCTGLLYIAQEAIKASGLEVSFEDVTITIDGKQR